MTSFLTTIFIFLSTWLLIMIFTTQHKDRVLQLGNYLQKERRNKNNIEAKIIFIIFNTSDLQPSTAIANRLSGQLVSTQVRTKGQIVLNSS